MVVESKCENEYPQHVLNVPDFGVFWCRLIQSKTLLLAFSGAAATTPPAEVSTAADGAWATSWVLEGCPGRSRAGGGETKGTVSREDPGLSNHEKTILCM